LRLTFTLPLINQATQVHFLVSGERKAEALRCVLEGPGYSSRHPARAVRPVQGSLTWWVDEGAAHLLEAST
jgi:6-phosphogluconolactonase